VKVLPESTQVLIVGAGPTGLALGINLRRYGVDCLVVDRLPAPLPGSRALGLNARSQELLESMGVMADINAAGNLHQTLCLHNEKGRLAEIDLTRIESRFAGALVLPQETLEDILSARFTALGGQLFRGCELSGFSQRDEQVFAHLLCNDPDQDQEGERTVSASLMVGCDGAHSFVRQQLGFSFDGVRYPDHFLLCDTHIDWALPNDCSHAFLLPEGALLALPMNGGWRLMINQPLQRDTRMESLSMAPFRQRLAQALGEAPALAEPDWISGFSIHRRLVSRYRLNRVLLAGDACHIQNPVGAQGMNTGIADACNLGWKIALFLDGVGGGELLDSYEAERRPVARQMLAGVDLLSRGLLSRAGLLRGARDSLLKALDGRPRLAARLLRRASQVDVHYRESALIMESAGGGRSRAPRAGDRLPTAPLVAAGSNGARRDVQQLLDDTRHQMLLVLPVVPDHAALVSAFALCDRLPQEYGHHLRVNVVVQGAQTPELAELREFDVDLYEPGDERLQTVFTESGGLWVVRPDGHIGFHGELDAATECLSWLRQFFRRR
jgi:pentachlorophenol monooxygenase